MLANSITFVIGEGRPLTKCFFFYYIYNIMAIRCITIDGEPNLKGIHNYELHVDFPERIGNKPNLKGIHNYNNNNT